MGHAYHTLSDDELVGLAQGGDRRAERRLLMAYRPLVVSRCRPYYLAGADHDDLLQEGLIGLHKAIRDFQPGRGSSFQRFAAMCVARHVISAVRTATRLKHLPLAGYAPLGPDDDGLPAADALEAVEGRAGPMHVGAAPPRDPLEAVVAQDGLDWIKAMLRKHLSGFEQQVLALYLRGASYREIALALQKNAKAIDNALARIKEKGRVLQLQMAFS